MNFKALLKAIFVTLGILLGLIVLLIVEVVFPPAIFILGVIAVVSSLYNYYK